MCVLDGRPDTRRLAAALDLDPARPPDELIAEAYALIGDGLLKRLDGEFAFAAWHPGTGSGLVARDRLGTRSLFVAEHGAALLFASEARTLLELLPRPPDPDPRAMEAWLARAPIPDDRTLFDGIRRLAPAHALRLGGGRWQPFRHWAPRPPEALALSAAEAAAEVRAALARASARALDGAARPGVLLSGGLDSAVVAAATVAEGARPVAYSGVFPDHPEADESERIRRTREHLGLEGVELALGGGSALEAAAEFMREWELPSVSPNRFLWAPLLRRAAADGTDVMLDGEGGDELFGAARYLVADRLRAGRPLAAVRVARSLPGMGAEPRAAWVRRALALYGARGALPAPLHERLRRARAAARGSAPPAPDPRWHWKSLSGPRWWAHLVHTLTQDAIGAADQQRREAAMHGLDVRHPLRDPELIDLVLALPPELAFDPHLDRPLVRRALAGDLPEATLRDSHKPFFNSLLDGALAGTDAPALRALLRDPHPLLAARVRREVMSELLEPSREGLRTPTWGIDLWRLGTLELWLEHRYGSLGDGGPG